MLVDIVPLGLKKKPKLITGFAISGTAVHADMQSAPNERRYRYT